MQVEVSGSTGKLLVDSLIESFASRYVDQCPEVGSRVGALPADFSLVRSLCYLLCSLTASQPHCPHEKEVMMWLYPYLSSMWAGMYACRDAYIEAEKTALRQDHT
jgi:hypothetical protein